ncbi:PAX3- and PAX7-binding protein 1 [Trichoplax sp. H2]|nr:PAX3- and PAX7-binding protein 1 [Trichoplax sp. H2]|eukprot:RDD43588.1 PAX3- and PAX7-binding protein 1 [Trichoplax sp. H2]
MIKRRSNKKNFRRKVDEDDEVESIPKKEIVSQSNINTTTITTTITTANNNNNNNNKSSTSKSASHDFNRSKINVIQGTNDKIKSSSKQVALSFHHDEDEGDVFVVKKSVESQKMAKLFKQGPEKAKNTSASHKSSNKLSGKKNVHHNLSFTSKEKTVHPSDLIVKAKFSSDIPDAATIHALKKQRELKRQYGSDYIPVDDTVRYTKTEDSTDKSSQATSRLVREDDNDKSDPEDDYRQLSFSNIKNTNSFPDTTEIDHVDEEDEEVSRWEQEQIKKGSAALQATPASSQWTNQQNTTSNNSNATIPNAVSQSIAIPTVPPTQPTVSIEDFRLKMKNRLQAATEELQAHQREMDRVTTYHQESQVNVTSLEQQSADACNRFTFFQDIRQYVNDLLECLNEKITTIQDCEETLQSLLKEKASRVVSRRTNDVKDEDDEYLGKTDNVESNVDEFGRDRKMFTNSAKQKRKEDRIARRNNRKRLAEKNNSEGLSTDDEIPESEETRIATEIEKVKQEGDKVFDDVVDDFHDIRKIMKQFERWKFSFSESYKDAYIPLCLPKLFSPFIRLQLLRWNIFELNTIDFENLPWFEQLMLYGSQSTDTELDPNDEDLLLLPNIVETVVLPKLKWMIEDVWDPLSNKQTQILISLMKRLFEEYPTVSADRKPTQEICSAAVKRMKRCLDNEMYIPLYHKKTFTTFPDATLFAKRQLWRCIKLYRNVFQWYGIIATNTLEEIAIDGLLNRYIILGMRNSLDYPGCVKQSSEIVESLPSGLFEEGSLVQLAVFSRFLVNLADNLNSQMKDARGSAQSTNRQCVVRIRELLKRMKEDGEASRILTCS